jgi:hypothetical protein
MKTQITIKYEGETYKSEPTEEMSAKDLKDTLYAQLEDFNKLEMTLEGGGFLLLPENAIKGCVIQIKDV